MSSLVKLIKDQNKLEKLTYDISESANNANIARECISIAHKYMLICKHQKGEISNLVKKMNEMKDRLGDSSMMIEDVVGVIVIGYPGIGKTAQAKEDNLFVDLESSCFKLAGDDRFDRWYMVYCNQAINLAEQGRVVFVSSHAEVREYLTSLPMPEGVVVLKCYPKLDLEQEWIKRLYDRYKAEETDKNFKAYSRAESNFKSNINEMIECKCPGIEIDRMGYSLKNLVLEKLKEI